MAIPGPKIVENATLENKKIFVFKVSNTFINVLYFTSLPIICGVFDTHLLNILNGQ